MENPELLVLFQDTSTVPQELKSHSVCLHCYHKSPSQEPSGDIQISACTDIIHETNHIRDPRPKKRKMDLSEVKPVMEKLGVLNLESIKPGETTNVIAVVDKLQMVGSQHREIGLELTWVNFEETEEGADGTGKLQTRSCGKVTMDAAAWLKCVDAASLAGLKSVNLKFGSHYVFSPQ